MHKPKSEVAGPPGGGPTGHSGGCLRNGNRGGIAVVMEISSPRRRLTAEARRSQILKVAGIAFARDGFAGATTNGIAEEAGISEALLFRHFKSKQGLFLAVLRDLLRRQDERVRNRVRVEDSRENLITGIRTYLQRAVLMQEDDEDAPAHRVLMASLAGDGHFARIIYHRSLSHRGLLLKAELEKAMASGTLAGRAIDPRNALCFIEHVASMLILGRLGERPVIPYAGDSETLIEDALTFCIRGIGLGDPSAAKSATNEAQP